MSNFNEINHLNVTVHVGSPTGKYHLLQGKYKRFVSEHLRESVENWYNNYSTPTQRANFKEIIRSVVNPENERVFKTAGEDDVLKAKAVLRCHGGEFIANEFKKPTVMWLAVGGEPLRQKFREAFGKIKPLRLFNGKSDYKLTFTPEGIHNTAEHVHQRNVASATRGRPPASSLPDVYPTSHISSNGGFQSATSVTIEGKKPPVALALHSARGTTYDAFFGSRPVARQQSAVRRREDDTRGAFKGPPWGHLVDGHTEGAFVSHTAASYPPKNEHFQNYNVNHAQMLAKQCADAAAEVRAAGVYSSNVSSVSGSGAAAARRRPSTARFATGSSVHSGAQSA